MNAWEIFRLLLSKLQWLLLAGLLCGAAVFLIVNFLIAPRYESRVSFYVYNSSESAGSTGTINSNDLQAAESLATTYSKILGSNSVLDAVIRYLPADEQPTRKELSDMTSVSVITDTQLLEVTVRAADPEYACRIADGFASIAPNEIVRITKAGGVEVVDYPEVATEKASPRVVFDTAVGVLVGMIVAAVVFILRMRTDTTLYLPEDLERLLGVTILGQIPEIEANDKDYVHWNMTEGGVVRYETKKNLAKGSGGSGTD